MLLNAPTIPQFQVVFTKCLKAQMLKSVKTACLFNSLPRKQLTSAETLKGRANFWQMKSLWRQRRAKTQRERGGGVGGVVGATHHSASSDEPDACCYADRRVQNGKRRERVEGRRKGGKVWPPASSAFSSLRSG